MKQQKIPLSEQPLLRQINWPHTILLLMLPAISIYGIATTPLQTKTLAFGLFYYAFANLGITAGYHRYYSHRSYEATLPFRVLIALAGTASGQRSILWWSRDHRVHHRFTDTNKDPYNAKRGFLWSHLGWMMFRKDLASIGHAEVDDLEADPLVMLQHKYYLPLAVLMTIILPTFVAGLGWGDWEGGYYYAGALRMTLGHHATFCINSLAHWLGEATFDDKLTPRDCFITALVTMGEGYHNFHHEFPQDYRNAIKAYQYDPTKWFIYGASLLGLTYDLKIFPENEVRKGEFLMEEKRLNKMRTIINWGVDIGTLPTMSFSEYKTACDDGKHWILIDNVIHDVTHFMKEHPGGIKYIRTYIGKDSSAAFKGQVYDHSTAARNLMASMRVARIS